MGLALPQFSRFSIRPDITTVARAAEGIGYDSVWVFERVLFPQPAIQGLFDVSGQPWPEKFRAVADPLIALTLAAAVTDRVRLGTSALIAPLHVPLQLARQLACLDAASGGRVVAGIGTGWSHDEFAAAAVAPFHRRGAFLDELLDVCAVAWGPDPVSFRGEWTTIAPAEVGPKPARPIPIYLPARTGRAFRRLVRRADGWMPIARGAPGLARGRETLLAHASAAGRTRSLDICVRANVAYTEKSLTSADRPAFHGDVRQIVDDLCTHVAVGGVTEVLLDLQATVRDAAELTDVAAELHAAAREAGV